MHLSGNNRCGWAPLSSVHLSGTAVAVTFAADGELVQRLDVRGVNGTLVFFRVCRSVVTGWQAI